LLDSLLQEINIVKICAMSKITNFFQPVLKSDLSVEEENNPSLANQVTSGKRRLDDNSLVSPSAKKKTACSPDSKVAIPLSPEQKVRCQENKGKAQLILLCKELHVLTPNIGLSWFTALKEKLGQDWFGQLSRYVSTERQARTVYPDQREVWEWTTRFSIDRVRVVILGQDPYHGPGQAHGLCFSVKPGIPAPPSLVNIFKELEDDIDGFVRPSHGCLTGWADQGVLLLNSVLTVRKGEANSHKNRGWEKLTDAVISWISKNLSGVVFLLWGSPAHKKALVVDRSKHHLLKSVHPSPLSAYRGFLGCKHFSQCNKLLKDQGQQPIDWTNLPAAL